MPDSDMRIPMGSNLPWVCEDQRFIRKPSVGWRIERADQPKPWNDAFNKYFTPALTAPPLIIYRRFLTRRRHERLRHLYSRRGRPRHIFQGGAYTVLTHTDSAIESLEARMEPNPMTTSRRRRWNRRRHHDAEDGTDDDFMTPKMEPTTTS